MPKGSFIINREKLEITISRIFNAPRNLVWKTYTDPKLIPQWWGPRSLKTVVDKMEFKVDGQWRFLHYDQNGTQFAFSGKYSQIIAPQKIIQSFIYEGYPNSIIVDTILFEDAQHTKTKLTIISQFPTKKSLEYMIKTGMKKGATQSWDRLEELLAKSRTD